MRWPDDLAVNDPHAEPAAGALAQNARDLERELGWLARIIDARFRLYFGEACAIADVLELTPPGLAGRGSEYARLVSGLGLDFASRLALILALGPHLRPQLLDCFFTRNQTFDRRFTEFGGVQRGEGGFVPSGETLAFLLGGTDLARRFQVRLLLEPGEVLQRAGVLAAAPEHPDQPLLQAPLTVADDVLVRVTCGTARRPAFGARFPAQFIETGRVWDDLVLHPGTRAQIDEIAAFMEHGETLMRDWGMAERLRPGLRCLFHGPPGTGKTMTACLLGRATGRDVYKVDLSLVVSKYIGETEKNLARVFDQAQSKGWILFFDEADALYGKRVEGRDAHDRYANQEIAFLLQRVETFDGVTILASNLKDNIDEAFLRRFETIVYFPMPRAEERLRLWRQGFSPRARFEDGLDLAGLAHAHPLSGGSIMNVIRFASLAAIRDGGRPIAGTDLLTGIRRELAKEGKAT
jgi:hypothetical protein